MAWLEVLSILVVVMAGRVITQIPSMEILGQWMRIAARAGDANYIKGLLDYGVPPDLQDPNGFTSLMWASYFNRSDCVSLLLDYGANVDHQNLKGDTSLMWASLGGFYDIAVDLVNHGADTNIQEEDGWSALMGAAVQGHYDVAEFLINSGADKSLTNVLGHAAITVASAMDQTDVVGLLADFTHIDHQDDREMTPLHHAAHGSNNYSVTLKKILEYCPNHTLTDVNNMTALEIAEESDFTILVELIKAYINASCTRFSLNYKVGAIIYQNCEELVCHCTGRWRLTGNKDPDCGQRNNIILTRQRSRGPPDVLASDC